MTRSPRGFPKRVRKALIAALAASACGIAEPIEDRLIGIVAEEEGVPVVSVPQQVAATEEFEVTVRTRGGACVRKGETEVELAGDTAKITPYDHYQIPRPGIGCLPTAETFQHTVIVTFVDPGEAVVVVRVREPESDEVTELQYLVSVRP
jgi:hypothetical protein